MNEMKKNNINTDIFFPTNKSNINNSEFPQIKNRPEFILLQNPDNKEELLSFGSGDFSSNKQNFKNSVVHLFLIIKLYSLVMKFVSRMKLAILTRNHRKKFKAVAMINDLSAGNPNKVLAKKFLKNPIFEKLKEMRHEFSVIWFVKRIPNFKKNSNFNKIWVFITTIFIIFNTLLIPLELAFDEIKLKMLRILFFIWFFFDFLKKINTKACISRNERYVSIGHFLVFLALTCNLFLGNNLGFWSWVINTCFYIKIKEFMKNLRKFLNNLHFSKIRNCYLDFLIYLCLILHYFSCFWVYVSKNQENSNSWFSCAELQKEKWIFKYLSSLKFLLQILCFQGSKDFNPTNIIEMLLYFLFMICSMLFLFLAIKQIAIESLKKVPIENNPSKEINAVQEYLSESNLNKGLKSKILIQMKQLIKKKATNDSKTLNSVVFLEDFPLNLKQELFNALGQSFFKNNGIFNKFSKATKNKTTQFLNERIYQKGDVICDKGSKDQFFYFISKGEVSFSFNSSRPAIFIKKTGDFFGSQEFFSGFPPKINAYASENTSVIALKREEFLKCLIDQREDYEHFCHIKDEINLEKNLINLKEPCKACGDLSHDEISCSVMHFIPQNALSLNYLKYHAKITPKLGNLKRKKKKSRTCFLKQNKEMSLKISDKQRSVEDEESYLNEDSESYVNIVKLDFDELTPLNFEVIKTNETSNYFPQHNPSLVIFKCDQKRRKIEKKYFKRNCFFKT